LFGYIFDLIDIKQKDDEPVISLKAQFLTAFSSLKMGDIGINSTLQVGFMLHTLLHRYHAVVQEFHLGPHTLSKASLQTVVNQCINYDKDLSWDQLAKTARLHELHQQMPPAPLLVRARMRTRLLRQNNSTITLVNGRRN
jgi:hypothetical protein